MSARGATRGAGDQRQVDVQARDEEKHVAISHTAMVPYQLSPVRVERVTAMSGLLAPSYADMAFRMSATASSSGVTDVSTTTSARDGGSYGSLMPVNSRISPARALA